MKVLNKLVLSLAAAGMVASLAAEASAETVRRYNYATFSWEEVDADAATPRLRQMLARKPAAEFMRREVRIQTDEKPGTVIVDSSKRYLYFVEGNGMATRYGVGVGKEGFGWSGTMKVGRKAEWPGWTPPAAMVKRERAKGREAHFKGLAEKHSFLPVPGRWEFSRELTHVLSNSEHLTPPPSLVVLHLVNADDIRRRFGRRALDAALIHVCAVIDANLHPTDVAGSLGGNDFGLILLVSNDELAQTKTQSLIDAVKAQPFPWQEETLTLEIAAGVATLENVDTPENAIQAADKELVASLGQMDTGPQEPTAEKA